LIIKTNALSSAVEAACLILSIDETVRNPQSEEQQRLKKAGPGAAGGADRQADQPVDGDRRDRRAAADMRRRQLRRVAHGAAGRKKK